MTFDLVSTNHKPYVKVLSTKVCCQSLLIINYRRVFFGTLNTHFCSS